jgi:hypothetical protein
VFDCDCEPVSTFPWTEGFENIGSEFPPCWKQEKVSGYDGWGWDWAVVADSVGVPPTAHGGNHKARIYLDFLGLPVYKTKLITPVFDLSGLDEPVLNFWHAQKGLGLLVYYRNSLGGEWVLLSSFVNENIPDWTQQIIPLPDKSNYYQIAFEGVFFSDLQLDDISISGETIYEVTLLTNLPEGGSFSGGGTFLPGTEARITANPNTDYNFVNWTKNNIEVSANSEYTFTVTENIELIAHFAKSILSITETIGSSVIKIYPNPSGGELKIVSGELKVDNIEIFDAFGKKVGEFSASVKETSIDISYLSAGVYFVKVNTEVGEVVKKVLKE